MSPITCARGIYGGLCNQQFCIRSFFPILRIRSMDRRNMTAIASLLAALLCWSAPVQAAQKTAVFVNASFLDKNRLYVENLKREEVRVFEDGQPREVEFFAGEEVPVAYGILLDRVLLPDPVEESRPYPDNVSSSTAALNVAYQLLDQCFRGQAGWAAAQRRTDIPHGLSHRRARAELRQLS